MLPRTFTKIKNILNIIVITLLCLFFLTPNVKAESHNDNLVNVYIIHSNNCSHCKEEIKFLNKLEEKYPNVKVYKLEISELNNEKIIEAIENKLNLKITSVPLTIIGEKYYFGYNKEKSPSVIKTTVDYYTKYGYKDEIAPLIGNIELPTPEISAEKEDIDEYIKENSNIEIIFNINSNTLDISSSATLLSIKESLNIINILILIISIIIFRGMNLKNKLKSYTTIILLNSIYQFLGIINQISNIILISILLIIASLFIITKIIQKQNSRKKNIIKYIVTILLINIILISKNIFLKNELLTLNKILNLNLSDNIQSIFNIVIYIIGYILMNIIIISLSIKFKNVAKKIIMNKKTHNT